MVRVLFVCLGNICRSPLAQGVFEAVVRREGLEHEVSVDSAGTQAYFAGSPPDERARRSAGLRGLDISSQRARRFSRDDCDDFDYVVTMDQENYATISAICQELTIVRPFLDFAPDSPVREIPDPYYGGASGFDRVLDLAEAASEGLLKNIRQRHLKEATDG